MSCDHCSPTTAESMALRTDAYRLAISLLKEATDLPLTKDEAGGAVDVEDILNLALFLSAIIAV